MADDNRSKDEKIPVSGEDFKMPADLAGKVTKIIFALVAGVLLFLGLFTAVMIFIVKNHGG